MSLTREEELACLIAEQEKDDQWGHRVFSVSLDAQLDGDSQDSETLHAVIGREDESLLRVSGHVEATAIRSMPRRSNWTRRQIISVIRKWEKEHGEPPRYKEWKRPNGRGIPSTASVSRKFGSWNAAIEAAGFNPRPVGGPAHSPERQGKRLVKRIRSRKRSAYLTLEQIAAAYVLYDRHRLSIPQIVERLWEPYGFRSRASCYTALLRSFHAEGFRLRTKREAAQLLPRSLRHDRAQKGGLAAAARRVA